MKNVDEDDFKKISYEIEFLISFWLTHVCGICNEDIRDRMPIKQFPNLYKFLSQNQAYKAISREKLIDKMKEHIN